MTASPGRASKNQIIQDQAKSPNNQIQLTELAAYEDRAPDLNQTLNISLQFTVGPLLLTFCF